MCAKSIFLPFLTRDIWYDDLNGVIFFVYFEFILIAARVLTEFDTDCLYELNVDNAKLLLLWLLLAHFE